ncbi:hypothetical protein [Xanthocytophaga agilis]|uniref:Uncharacterized protein n=1 Tax=Xanthocytophaga agilis TaxID=3048010 RepID=A0AAE3RDX4_9BACT|nr:hypothetical protein [Xanthocytophaga agilis]MDJ1506734.1 hypothetical protein [Xanthocytophaga agilis]
MSSSTTLLSLDNETIARRIAVVDMLRGIALILLTLGCILVWFHESARFSQNQTISVAVTITRYLAEAGALALIFVLGMSIFFFKKYHFSIEKYNVAIASFIILALYSILFSAPLFTFLVQFSFWFWVVILLVLLCLGWSAGYLFQNYLLLDAEKYMVYMNRKHDFRKVMLVFGQAPLFFFITMLFFVQVLSWLTVLSAGFTWTDVHLLAGYTGLPNDFGYTLPRVYLVGFCLLALLYPLCKAYGHFKALHPHGWLKYL